MGMFSDILDVPQQDNRSEYTKQKEAAAARADALMDERAAERFKPYRCLIPFVGPMAVRLAGSYKSVDLRVDEFDYGVNQFLVYREDMRKIDPGTWTVGKRTDGTVRLITTYGLAYIVDEPITEGEFKDYVVFTEDGTPVLSAEGMLAVIDSRKFVKYEPADTRWIRRATAAEITAREQETQASMAWAREQLKDGYTKKLTELGVEVTDETLTLMNFIETHDYYASYSDDASVWRHHSAREQKAIKYLEKHPALMQLFKQHPR